VLRGWKERVADRKRRESCLYCQRGQLKSSSSLQSHFQSEDRPSLWQAVQVNENSTKIKPKPLPKIPSNSQKKQL